MKTTATKIKEAERLKHGYEIVAQKQSANGKEFITEFEVIWDDSIFVYQGDRFRFFNIGDILDFKFTYGNKYKKYGQFDYGYYKEYQYILNPRKVVLLGSAAEQSHSEWEDIFND